jgi:hypothetical protein
MSWCGVYRVVIAHDSNVEFLSQASYCDFIHSYGLDFAIDTLCDRRHRQTRGGLTSGELLQLRLIAIEHIRIATIVVAICILPDRIVRPAALWIARLIIPVSSINFSHRDRNPKVCTYQQAIINGLVSVNAVESPVHSDHQLGDEYRTGYLPTLS